MAQGTPEDSHSPRFAFLGPISTPPTQLDVLRTALAELGLVEGRNIVIDSRWPEVDRLDRLPESAAALVALKPAVIIAIGGQPLGPPSPRRPRSRSCSRSCSIRSPTG